MMKQTRVLAKFKVPCHFAQRDRRGDLVNCLYVLIQGVDNRSLFTFNVNDWFIWHGTGNTLSEVFEVYIQASISEKKGGRGEAEF